MYFLRASYLLLPLLVSTGRTGTYQKYSTWMLESIVSRDEGVSAADGLLGEIQKVCFILISADFLWYYCADCSEKGFFQQALRAAIESTEDVSQARKWSNYHNKSVQAGIKDLLDATADAKAPLDRLCAGRSLLFVSSKSSKLIYLHQYFNRQTSVDKPTNRAALQALRKSIDLQLRSTNGMRTSKHKSIN